MEGTDRAQSEFNMAMAWLNRLNYWFYICDENSHKLDVYNWFHTLMILFRELTTEMKDEERKAQRDKAKDIFQRVEEYIKQQARPRSSGIPTSLYWDLHDFEDFLRNVMNKSGLLKKIQEDAGKALK